MILRAVLRCRCIFSVTGSSSLPPPTTHAPLYRAPPALQTEYAERPAAAFVPAAGAANSVSSRPTPAGRHAPVLVRGPPGRLPPPPPYAVARPPFPVPLGHSRTDTRWPRPRPLGGGYLVAPNGVRPPPPPIGGAPGGRKECIFLRSCSMRFLFQNFSSTNL